MNSKLIKTIEQIEKNTTKIAELQAATKKLMVQRTQLENDEIVAAVRTGAITDFKDIQKLLSGEYVLQAQSEGRPAAPVPAPKVPEVTAFNNNDMEEKDDE